MRKLLYLLLPVLVFIWLSEVKVVSDFSLDHGAWWGFGLFATNMICSGAIAAYLGFFLLDQASK